MLKDKSVIVYDDIEQKKIPQIVLSECEMLSWLIGGAL